MNAVFDIILSLFAILGLYFVVSTILDFAVSKKTASKSVILIEECDPSEIDYLVRYYQGKLINPILDTIVIAPTVNVSDKLVGKLNKEFKNVKKM